MTHVDLYVIGIWISESYLSEGFEGNIETGESVVGDPARRGRQRVLIRSSWDLCRPSDLLGRVAQK